MSKTKQSAELSSENCRKLSRLGMFEDPLDALIERLLGIYYELRENTTRAATYNGRAEIGEPNKT